MDVSTNGFSSSGYRAHGSYYGGAAGASPGASTDSFSSTQPRKMQFGDSLIGTALPRKAPAKNEADPAQMLKMARIARGFGWVLSGLAFFIFIIMVLQPILLPLFTFGACFSGGFGEWMDFSFAVLKVSLIPLALGLIFGWVGYFAHRKVAEVSEKLEQGSSVGANGNMPLSPALMARLTERSNLQFPA